ncbi:MAG: metallophosphoesterase [Clostridia bacterium]|nr:metallophosphoesterase [Clostridia bacterium]
MKTRHHLVRILTLLLFTVLLLTAGCGENPPVTDPDITTGDPGTSGPAETTDDAETTSEAATTDDPNAEYTVSVTNGVIVNATPDNVYKTGTPITLSAVTPPKGYRFSHWENASGETVGDKEETQITVSKNDTYKAYYEVAIGKTEVDPGTLILSDLKNDWQQGGINGSLNTFSTSDPSRISLAKPFLLKKGQVLSVSIPADNWTCPTLTCKNGCTIAIAKMILKKNPGKDTGDLLTDYSFAEKAAWTFGGFRYEATEDVYVMLTVKYDKHGALSFNVQKPIMQKMQITCTTKEDEIKSVTPVGTHWEPELENAEKRIRNHRKEIGEGAPEFFFITDVHWKDYNAQFSPALISYLAERLGVYHVVFGGDVIELNATREGAINEEIRPFYSALRDYTKVGEQLKILSTLGNHDRNYLSKNTPDSNTVLSDDDVYELYVAPTKEWAVTLDGNPYCSYYDDTANKVRYLQFSYASNTVATAGKHFEEMMLWTEAQITSLDADWTVVLFSHGIFEGTQNEDLDAVRECVLSWQKKSDAEIAIWITGHTHGDDNQIFVSKDGKTALRAISLNCDSYNKLGSDTVSMIYGTATEQSFSFIQIDKANETIYLTRVGAGKDLKFTYGDAMKDEYVAAPYCSVRVVNGTVNGQYYTSVRNGAWVTLKADTPPAGYEFSCWKNLRGEVVGTTPTLPLQVTESTQYKPYYVDVDPTNDITVPNAVKTDLANDWTHGGMGNTLGEWWLDNEHHDTRTSFAEPIFLKKGQTITVKLPPIDCPTGTCVGGCSLATLIAAMDKTGESETGYLPHEYTIHYLKWSMSYTATKDTYVSILVKYDKHGHDDFSVANEEMQGVVITVTP